MFQLKIFFTNRIGLLAVLTNFLLAILGLFQKDWSYDSFHFTYEPVSIKVLAISNLLVINLAESISRSLLPFPNSNIGNVRINAIEMLLIVIFSIFQWLFFGYLLSSKKEMK